MRPKTKKTKRKVTEKNHCRTKAVLFDLDGVVFDTEPQYTRFWGGECRRYHPEHSGLEVEIKGQTLTQIFDRWFDGPLEPERAAITERLNAFEAQMDFPYVAGFADFITRLRSVSIQTAVVTSSNRPKMEAVYRRRPEFTSLFDAILTSEDFAESKPSPDCYLRGAARCEARPDECIVIEDSFNGLRSGQSSGARVVGLSTTNAADKIAPYCHLVVPDYLDAALWPFVVGDKN